jgi:hypothetical protein
MPKIFHMHERTLSGLPAMSFLQGLSNAQLQWEQMAEDEAEDEGEYEGEDEGEDGGEDEGEDGGEEGGGATVMEGVGDNEHWPHLHHMDNVAEWLRDIDHLLGLEAAAAEETEANAKLEEVAQVSSCKVFITSLLRLYLSNLSAMFSLCESCISPFEHTHVVFSLCNMCVYISTMRAPNNSTGYRRCFLLSLVLLI